MLRGRSQHTLGSGQEGIAGAGGKGRESGLEAHSGLRKPRTFAAQGNAMCSVREAGGGGPGLQRARGKAALLSTSLSGLYWAISRGCELAAAEAVPS